MVTPTSSSFSTPSRRIRIAPSNNLACPEVTPFLDNPSRMFSNETRDISQIETSLDKPSFIVSPERLNVDCLEGPVEPEYSPALVEDFAGVNWDINVTSPERYPLMEELGVLNELVDNMRVDLLQSSMLLTYIKDYLRKK